MPAASLSARRLSRMRRSAMPTHLVDRADGHPRAEIGEIGGEIFAGRAPDPGSHPANSDSFQVLEARRVLFAQIVAVVEVPVFCAA